MEHISELVKKLFLEKNHDTRIQFLRYIFVGGAATIVDMGSLYILTSIMGLNYLISAAIAFILGVATNYLLCIAWIFESTGRVKKEIILFVVIGVGGLILNEVIIWLLVEEAKLYYMLAKTVAVVIVLVWNFGMRKKYVFTQ